MIIDLFFYVLGSVLDWAAIIAPEWSFYSTEFLEGINWFGEKLSSLDFITFGLSAEILALLITLFIFEGSLLLWDKLQSLINFLRGSGSLKI